MSRTNPMTDPFETIGRCSSEGNKSTNNKQKISK